MLFVPLNESAEPNLPAVAHVAPEIVPVFVAALSPIVVPLLSSIAYAATRPTGGAVGDGPGRLSRSCADVPGCVLGGDPVVVRAGGEAGVGVARAGRLGDPVRRRSA